MITIILKWLSKKGLLRLRVLKDGNGCYCPMCLSDIKVIPITHPVKCEVCDILIYPIN